MFFTPHTLDGTRNWKVSIDLPNPLSYPRIAPLSASLISLKAMHLLLTQPHGPPAALHPVQMTEK
jgi:hypothetical protein